jgi:hypothetical protein
MKKNSGMLAFLAICILMSITIAQAQVEMDTINIVAKSFQNGGKVPLLKSVAFFRTDIDSNQFLISCPIRQGKIVIPKLMNSTNWRVIFHVKGKLVSFEDVSLILGKNNLWIFGRDTVIEDYIRADTSFFKHLIKYERKVYYYLLQKPQIAGYLPIRNVVYYHRKKERRNEKKQINSQLFGIILEK